MQYFDAGVEVGEEIHLQREADNPHDRHAIRVDNRFCEPVGYLPRPIGCWLAPLVDEGKIRVDGGVPELSRPMPEAEPGSRPIKLTIFLYAKGNAMLLPRAVRSKLDGLHELVRRVYADVQGYADPALILEMADGLSPLARQELFPETRLLLALLPAIAREVRAAEAVRKMVEIRATLTNLTVGPAIHHHNLTMFPLSWAEPGKPPYRLLGPAIEAGEALVEEVSHDGSVPHLLVTNKGDCPVLVPEGVILVGAKQNRLVNVTVLVPPRSNLTLPVSCVEQGRWRYEAHDFQAKFHAPPSLRSRNMRAVHLNRTARGAAESDQRAVWDEVARNLDERNIRSKTASLADGLRAAERQSHRYRDRLRMPEHASGVLVAQADRVVALDLFDSPDTLQAVWERLSGAYFFEAGANADPGREASLETASRFVQRIAACVRPRVPALGLGEEYEIVGQGVVGAALVYSGRVCHLASFGLEDA
jgi:hypothetical protein